MDRIVVQQSLESVLPFECSHLRVTEMEALLLDDHGTYYTEPVLDRLAKGIVDQEWLGYRGVVTSCRINEARLRVFLFFGDGHVRGADLLDSKLPWKKCKVMGRA